MEQSYAGFKEGMADLGKERDIPSWNLCGKLEIPHLHWPVAVVSAVTDTVVAERDLKC